MASPFWYCTANTIKSVLQFLVHHSLQKWTTFRARMTMVLINQLIENQVLKKMVFWRATLLEISLAATRLVTQLEFRRDHSTSLRSKTYVLNGSECVNSYLILLVQSTRRCRVSLEPKCEVPNTAESAYTRQTAKYLRQIRHVGTAAACWSRL